MANPLSKEEFASKYRSWRSQLTRSLQGTICGVPVTLTEVCEDGTCLFSVTPEPWMTNPGGVMHGGLICTFLDTAMGSVAGCVTGHMTPSVSIHVDFVRPVLLDTPVCIRVHAPSIGGTLAYMTAELWQADETRPCAVASGTYFTK